MPVELKPCPFCGGKAEVIRGWVFGNKRPQFKVYCKSCQVRQVLVKQRCVAVSNWNQRAKQVEEKFTSANTARQARKASAQILLCVRHSPCYYQDGEKCTSDTSCHNQRKTSAVA